MFIYNANFSRINRKTNTDTNCFYLYAYELFKIRIVSYSEPKLNKNIPKIYSSLSESELISSQYELSGNYCYTIYIPENEMSVVFEISNGIENMYYEVHYKNGNLINETNEHYKDLLDNHFLPSYEDLSKATVNSELFDTREMIKRLLLDFVLILKNKGTKLAIENFFKYLGYDGILEGSDNLKLFEEYKKDDGQITLTPNIHSDIKTGYYHALYNYFDADINDQYDDNNMPKIVISILNYAEFCSRIFHAIKLANIYFTLDEQQIIEFNLNFMTNIPVFRGYVSRCNLNSNFNVMNFQSDININAKVYENSIFYKDVILNKTQKMTQIPISEVKYILNGSDTDNMFYVDDEVFDDNMEEIDDLSSFRRQIGKILHFNISAIKKYVEYKITGLNGFELNYDKSLIDGSIDFKLMLHDIGAYKMEIKFYDDYNGMETYFYNFILSSSNVLIEFECFGSGGLGLGSGGLNLSGLGDELMSRLDDNVQSVGNLSLESSMNGKMISWNGVGFDDYWSGEVRDFINVFKLDGVTGNEWDHKYLLKKYRNNIKTNDDSSIPVKFLEDWVCHISFEHKDGDEFYLRTCDGYLTRIGFSNVIIRQNDIDQINNVLKNFYIALKDIKVDEIGTIKKFWILMATQTSLEMNKDNFDFVIINNNQNYSIYDFANTDRNYVKRNLPLMKTIPLTISNNELCFSPDHCTTPLYTTPTTTLHTIVPSLPQDYDIIKLVYSTALFTNFDETNIQEFISKSKSFNSPIIPYYEMNNNYDIDVNNNFYRYFQYIGGNYYEIFPTEEITEIKPNLYHHVFVIKSGFDYLSSNVYELKCNDYIFCKLDEKYIINAYDVCWSVYDTFSKELLMTIDNRYLKFRMNKNQCIDVKVNFKLKISDTIKECEIIKESIVSTIKNEY